MSKLSSREWKALLPKSYEWLNRVKVGSAQGPVKSGHHVIAAEALEGGKFRLVASNLEKKYVDGLEAVLLQRGWRSAGTQVAEFQEAIFLIVPLTKIRVSASQKGRQLGLDASALLKGMGAKELVLQDCEEVRALDILDGLAQGYYCADSFKEKCDDSLRLPETLTFLGEQPNSEAFRKVAAMSNASSLCRFLQDAPANWLDPLRFAEIAEGISVDFNLKCRILDKAQLEELKMGSLLGVAKGSVIEPRVIDIEVEGEDTSKTIALVGKGLTFDAGGISIKPSAGMGEMKYDMSGGAAVLGAAALLGQIRPPVSVRFLIGAVENMPSGSAVKPGDILESMSGKTIEVLNTDAEGRLVLADLLHYAIQNYKPTFMIDAATLTGAVLHGLGSAGGGLMGNDDRLNDYLLNLSKEIGEPFWQLPLWPELQQEVKGEVADLQNIAKPNIKAGTIMGGMFLAEFAAGCKWAHLDIAGTAWSCKATGYPQVGGSAFGMRLMAEACLHYQVDKI